MNPSGFSENTYFSVLAARQLGESTHARLARDLKLRLDRTGSLP